jgi:uncharacterized protein (DUF302 family)
MANEDPRGVVILSGDGDVDRLLRRAVAEIEGLDLDVLEVIDHSGDAHEAGLHMPETKLVLFGNPRVATRLILAHPLIALDLPLRLLISARSDDDVSVSYNAPGHLAQRHGLNDDEADLLRVVETVARAIWSTS